ncbi:ankyrin repeat domain-containing protein 50-like [Haliotis rufescens]|uniref:ankyrin repeat domain-containing protein 50-like n=1 Tax=Haliotis rufescens TaxID=6454 RepID=UPI00201F62E4|nr:ankyrin repeat domain-containing protein 50-like [Haliotis rufescens]
MDENPGWLLKRPAADTPLHKSTADGDLDLVKQIMNDGEIHVNTRGLNGLTPLMLAAQNGNYGVFEYLLSVGADMTQIAHDGDHILSKACVGGNMDIVKYVVLKEHSLINKQRKDGRTALMWAAWHRKKTVFDYLLKEGADSSLVDVDGYNMLHYACFGGDTGMVNDAITNTSVDINTSDIYGRTAVMVAAACGYKDMVDLLFKKESDLSHIDKTGNNILHVACLGGHVKIVEHILSQEDTDINCRGQYGGTPLMLAAFDGHREVFDLLVTKGADATLVCNKGNTILHVACIGGHVDLVKPILSQGMVDINSQRQDGRTPLLLAAFCGHREVFDLLVRNGANASVVCNKGNTILHVACIGGHVEMVEHIMSQGIGDVNSQNQDGRTPLLLAAFGGHREVFDLLVRNGANASVVCNKGNTILHVACIGGHVEMVEHIMSQGIGDVNSQNQDGRTPLMSAELQGCGETLLSPGVDLSQMNDKGNNVLHLACETGSMEIVQHVVSQNSLDINAKNSKGETATRVAKRKHHMDLYEWLVSQGGHVVSKSYKH